MSASVSSAKRPLPLALSLGVLGGAALIVTTVLTTKGPMIFLPYAALVLASLGAVRLAGWPDFWRRFTATFLAFMVATVVLYVFIGTVQTASTVPLSAWGHTWRLGLMAGIGALLSAASAYLADLGFARRGRYSANS